MNLQPFYIQASIHDCDWYVSFKVIFMNNRISNKALTTYRDKHLSLLSYDSVCQPAGNLKIVVENTQKEKE